jgi:1-acyl-sn-glycerol-3-phosphate acyltransferase
VVQFLAQSGLAKRGLLRWWLQKVGVVLIDRKAPSKDALRFLSEALEQGGCVGLFAEGTRSLDGSVGAFRSGIDFLVRRTGATVIPAGIEGSFRSFPRGAKWPRPAKCTVRLGTPRSAAEVLAPGGVEALRQEVARLANAKLGN